jgi:GT2 family glycosyltransferase
MWQAAKYWAGQKLLHSRWHPLYLRVTGRTPPVPSYERYCASESADPFEAPRLPDYELVLPPGVQLAPAAEARLHARAAETGADLLYADEDQVDSRGLRRAPVFKPADSPELASHCDYWGRAYLCRRGVDPRQATRARVPGVLFHHATPPEWMSRQSSVPEASAALVSMVICSRNPALLQQCLAAIRDTTRHAAYELIVVHHVHPANDGAIREICTRFRAARVPYTEAFHFGRMCEAGIQASNGELILLLNDDTVPLDAHWLGHLVSQASRPGIGAVGALLTYPDGRLQHAGVLIGTPNGAGHPGRLTRGRPEFPWLTLTRDVSAVTGACLLMPRRVFHQVGGFDAEFPVNYNDVDLCLRMRQHGYRILFEARARVEHQESTTRRGGIGFDERQRFLSRWQCELDRGDPFYHPHLTDDERALPDRANQTRALPDQANQAQALPDHAPPQDHS